VSEQVLNHLQIFVLGSFM
jgi:hypothetical protein